MLTTPRANQKEVQVGRTMRRALLAAVLAAALVVSACGSSSSDTPTSDAATATAPSTIPQPSEAQLQAAGLADLPLAAESKRLDIVAPTFTNPTEITNPLFPVSDLQSVVFNGTVSGKPFHTETTLLPGTKLIEWSDGQQVEALTSQYTAYIDGRIEEVALDSYAQADDGSVWYLGEDVTDFNQQGLSDGDGGTWLAGRDGPPEMIMPADPHVGDVHRAENIPGIAFEEVEIKKVNETFPGPTGPIDGVMVASELHDDGTFSDKVFAPGYGEFFTAHGGEVEALALAVPTDAASGPVPTELEALSNDATGTLGAIESENWAAAAAGADRIANSWAAFRKTGTPRRLTTEMDRAVSSLKSATHSRDRAGGGIAAVDVGLSALDQKLRYLPQPEIDFARFGLWTRRLSVHAADRDMGGVNGDVTTLGLIRDRFAQTLDPADLTAIDARLEALQETVVDVDVKAAAAEGEGLREDLQGIRGV